MQLNRIDSRRSRLVVLFILVGFIFAVGASVAIAATPTADGVSWLDRLTIWIYTQQRIFHRELTGHLRALAGGAEWSVGAALIGASFLYGLFHAAGPGHGKAVMTGYLVTHKETVRRGVILAVAAAFCQGLVAIIIVYGFVTMAGLLPRETQTAILWSERASFFLVALIGAFLLYRGFVGLKRRIQAAPQCHDRSHDHSHDHTHDCGHVHMPAAEQVARASDFKTLLGIVLSIGIRPCTGAVIVLVFAKATALAWVGVAAVAAMSLGTAVAIASLAAMAVGSRGFVSRLSITPPKYAGHVAELATVLGGGLILVVGLSLLSSAFGTAHPIMGG